MDERGGRIPRAIGWVLAHAKRVVVFILGVSLLILSVALGWLPGPGGIPLALAGLWLLSTEFDWAKRWRRKVKAHLRAAVDKVKSNRDVRRQAAVNVRELHARGDVTADDVRTIDLAVDTQELDLTDAEASELRAGRAAGSL